LPLPAAVAAVELPSFQKASSVLELLSKALIVERLETSEDDMTLPELRL
jgi:hypothetical protein